MVKGYDYDEMERDDAVEKAEDPVTRKHFHCHVMLTL